MRRWAVLAVMTLLCGCASSPQDSEDTRIVGVVTVKGGPLVPDATVVVSTEDGKEIRLSADQSGRYDTGRLTPGRHYRVRAEFGNLTTERGETDVLLAPGQIARIDLPMVQTLSQISWAPPSDLEGYWREADAVVRGRVQRTTEFIAGGWTQEIAVVEVLKGAPGVSGRTMNFWHDESMHDREPYALGQEMVLFLKQWKRTFRRIHGPFGAFLVRDGLITHPAGAVGSFTPGATTEAFLAALRTLGQKPH